MKRFSIALLSVSLLGMGSAIASGGQITPVTFEKVQLHDHFWAPWQQRQIEVTIPVAFKNTEPALENQRRTACFLAGEACELPIPSAFLVSDLYKVLESASYSLTVQPDAKLEAEMDAIIDVIAAAQRSDGYMYEAHICGIPIVSQMGTRPYSHLGASHELYNVGHLYEAAVAYYRATGKDKLLKVAEKSAQHVNHVFFEGDPAFNDGQPVDLPPGHQEIELALCQMFDVTGDSLYLQLARRFLDIRGIRLAEDKEYGLMHSQQHLPVRDQREPAGHAVRAVYMYTGMADVDALYDTDEYGEALDAIWENMVSTRMAITGGLGAVRGIEAFGPEYLLPNKESYNETCASVGNVFFNDRMFRKNRDGRYYDVLEAALFNGALAGISLSGDRFFYINPLEADGEKPFNHGLRGRSEWFGCACCPPNISRLIMKIAGYMYAYSEEDIYFTLYGSSSTEVPLKTGLVRIDQESNYPFSGDASMVLNPEKPMRFAVRLRIPTWARSQEFLPGGLYTYADPVATKWSVKVNGKVVKAELENGFAVVDRKWKAGDRVELSLEMIPRYVKANPKVEADRDRIAITRGPLVYCAEEPDNGLVQEIYLSSHNTLGTRTMTEGVLEGTIAVTLTGSKLNHEGDQPITLIPYNSWNNRGEGSMVIWIPENAELARESLPTTIRNREWLKEAHLTGNNSEEEYIAIFDGLAPARSRHMGLPYWTSRGFEGEPQQATFLFTKPMPLASYAVYWIDDARTTSAVPASWSLEYLKDGEWRPFPIYLTDIYGIAIDQFNEVRPSGGKLVCEGLRMNIIPQSEKSIGAAEIQINFEE